MDKNTEFSTLINEIIHTSLDLLSRAECTPDILVPVLRKLPSIYADLNSLSDYFLQHPQPIQDGFLAYSQEAQALFQTQLQYWSGITSIPSPNTSRRFNAEEWAQHPFFHLISQHYALLETHLSRIFNDMPDSNQTNRKRVQFLIQQYYQALSPENFLLTNPQLLKETIQDNGLNLLRGLAHFLQDIQTKNSEHWTMPLTDVEAFKVGQNLAVTAGKVVFQNELIELIQYSPQTDLVHAVPLLLIPPWINKYYIFDLRPENSMVRYLVNQGITVYIISWRNPDKDCAHWGLNDYLQLGPIAALNCIQERMQISQVSALGFCIGGTLLTILLAYYKAKGIHTIASATLLASLIDFSEPGELGIFIHEQQIEALEKSMSEQGYLAGDVMAAAFHSLRPADLIWRVFVQRYLYGQPPGSFDLLFWNMDTTNMPAKMHSEYLRGMYLNNDLVKPGRMMMDLTPLDVSKIDIPVFFLATQKDHIAPWQSTYQGFHLLSGPKRYVLGGSGHIAGIIIPPGNDKYGFYTNPVNAAHPEEWMSQSEYHKGSWWPEWVTWLKAYSGQTVDSTPLREGLDNPTLIDAPGTYVHTKSK